MYGSACRIIDSEEQCAPEPVETFISDAWSFHTVCERWYDIELPQLPPMHVIGD
jgi:hypothetical protein